MAAPLFAQVTDARSRRVAFVAHCLLNENVRFLGGATRPGGVDEIIESYMRDGVGIVQLPCPEQRAWGGVLKRRMLGLYGRRGLRVHSIRRVVVRIVRAATALEYRRLARRTATEIADYVSSGFEVVAVVGVGASPSCGVVTTLDVVRVGGDRHRPVAILVGGLDRRRAQALRGDPRQDRSERLRRVRAQGAGTDRQEAVDRGSAVGASSLSEVIGLNEAAERMGVHYMTAYRYVRTGVLPATQRNGRWVVPLEAVEALRRGEPKAPSTGGTRRGPRRSRLTARMIDADAAGAWTVVEGALASGASPRRVELELIAPTLRDIGDRWARGEITVGQEHTASAVASRLVGRLGPLLTRRGPSRGMVVVAGAPGEHHTLCMVMLADLLRADGWQVVELGGDTPAEELAAATRGADRLTAVAICVGSADTRAASSDAAAAVRAAAPGVTIFIGGPGVTDHDDAIALGADAYGRDADEVSAVLDGLGGRRQGDSSK